MKPKKVETAVQWFRISQAVLDGFSGHGYSISNIMPLFKNLKKCIYTRIINDLLRPIFLTKYKGFVIPSIVFLNHESLPSF